MRGSAPAKVNLWLEVLGRRADGYHELETLFQTVAWGDDVAVEPTESPDVVLEVRGADGLPADDANLAVRAVRAWREASGDRHGARIRLTKRLPVGGGLGGGSSDAACVLRLLQALHPARALDEARLHEVAAGLGSDVPFLVRGGTAIGRGRGEALERLPSAPSVVLVLLIPPFPTSTAAVYARVAERIGRAPAGGLARAVAALASGDPARIRDAHHNDLAEAALRATPGLLRFTAEAEARLGRPPALSGSGSTLYDVPDEGETKDVLARLEGLAGRREVVRTSGV